MSEAKPKPTLNMRRLIIFLIVGALLLLFATGILSITGIWNLILMEPIMNFLVLLSKYLFGSFGLAIIILTIIIRLITMPLTLRQLRSSKAMQALQPKIKELQKKLGKDQQQLGQETMKLYKEQGINPLGCVWPMLVQFPIWIALYQAVIQALAYSPENLLGLSKQLYSSSIIQSTVPLSHHFLGLDLTQGNVIMAILVAASMWMLQKMSTSSGLDPSQQSMNRMMTWIMPLMFGFIAISFPSGLSLYWVASNLIGILMQYPVTGWGDLRIPSWSSISSSLRIGRKSPQPANPAAKVEEASGREKKAVKGVAGQQEQASTGSAGAERKEAVGGTSSQRKKGRHGRHRGKRKN